MTMKDIGKNIKEIRQAKEMTQEALAEALYVTRQTVSNYENGRSRPDLDMLLKIAEVLETDVSSILYGPPMPQSKKDACKWAVISLSVLAVSWTIYFVINWVFDDIFKRYMYNARILNLEVVIPIAMFVLGWTLLHILSMFSALTQFQKERVRIARMILMVIGCALVIIPLPFVVWHAIAFYRSLTESSVSMTFPHIPVYSDAYMGILRLSNQAPFAYTILGGLFWLFGIPSIKK